MRIPKAQWTIKTDPKRKAEFAKKLAEMVKACRAPAAKVVNPAAGNKK